MTISLGGTHRAQAETAKDGGRDYSDAATAKGCLGPPEAGRGTEGSSLGASNTVRALADTLAVDFWPVEQWSNKVLSFKMLGLGN